MFQIDSPPTSAVSPIESDTVSGLQPPRCGAQICTGCLKQKVIVVRHQAEGMDRQAKSLDGFLDGFEKRLAIRIIAMFNLTTGYFLSQRAFETLVEGKVTDPENIERQKRLLSRLVRSALVE